MTMHATQPPATLEVVALAGGRGGRQLFQQLHFSLKAGDLLLLEGANGCGKTSLLRILSTLSRPTAGRIFWQGVDVRCDYRRYRAMLRYLAHENAQKSHLRVAENLQYHATLGGSALHDTDALLAKVGLQGLADHDTSRLSAGQKRRLAIACLIAVPASLWLLDEPLNALDHAGRKIMRSLIVTHCDKGGIVVAASHETIHRPLPQRLRLDEHHLKHL